MRPQLNAGYFAHYPSRHKSLVSSPVHEKLRLMLSVYGLNTQDPLVYCSISMKCPEKAKLQQTANRLLGAWG